MSSFDLHHLLLSDGLRLRAVRRALRETVKPGSVVVDLGAGTGILGFLALRAGASRVYAIERHPILRLARAVAAENGFGERVRFIQGDSRRVRLPERADLVISDFVGPLGMDSDTAESLYDARRFLKKRGRFVPERCEIWMAPVRDARLHRRHVRSGQGHGVRLDSVHAIAANRLGCFRGTPRSLAAPLRRVMVFEYPRVVYPRRARIAFRVTGGAVHGLAVVMRLCLSRTVSLTARNGSHLAPVYLPVRHPIETRAGQRLEAEVVLHDGSNLEWRLGDQRQSSLLERAAYA